MIENEISKKNIVPETFNDVHTAQILSYLRLGKYKLGLFFNFQTTVLIKGIKRVIN